MICGRTSGAIFSSRGQGSVRMQSGAEKCELTALLLIGNLTGQRLRLEPAHTDSAGIDPPDLSRESICWNIGLVGSGASPVG